MATTTVTVAASTHGVAFRHVNFSVESSTPNVGAAFEGRGEWTVWRGGTAILKKQNRVRFAWRGMDKDVVQVRYVDRAGNAGAYKYYRFSVTGSYAFEQYVDSVSGDNGNAGTSSGVPVQTIAQAKANVAANLVAGGVHCIWLKEAQTHACGGASAWAGSDSTAAVIHIRRWGTSGARPLVTSSGVTLSTCGKKQGVIWWGVSLRGGTGQNGFGDALNFNRTGAGAREPLNAGMIDCDVEDFHDGVQGEDDTLDGTNRATGTNQFLILENVAFANQWEYHLYGANYMRHALVRSVTLGGHSQAWTNPWRVASWEDSYVEGVLFNGAHNGSMRFPSYLGSDSATRRLTIADQDYRGTDSTLSGISFSAISGTGTGYIEDVEVTCGRFDLSSVRFSLNAVGGTNNVDVKRFMVRRCTLQRSIVLGAQASGGTYDDLVFRNNIWIGEAWAGDVQGLTFTGPEDRFVAGGVTFVGNVGYWPDPGNDGDRPLLSSGDEWTRATLSSKLALCDYNMCAKVDDVITYVARHSDSPWLSDVGAWQAATPHDDNTTEQRSTTLNLTNNGLAGLVDARPTASGPMANTGQPSTYEVDADGKVCDANPDRGPFEYSATTLDEPDAPVPPVDAVPAGTLALGLGLGL
ncbi:MAG: hypothetical protein WAT39_01900 [Planctomycetota bacterium]